MFRKRQYGNKVKIKNSITTNTDQIPENTQKKVLTEIVTPHSSTVRQILLNF